MKFFLLFFLTVLNAHATFLPQCPVGTMQTWNQLGGANCTPQVQAPIIESLCTGWGQPTIPFTQFPSPLYQPQILPWWAYQGNLYYPNVSYPGPWQYPGIQSNYYPGQGQIFAAKPNVYIDSIHKEKKFTFRFVSENKHFLATTPLLEEDTFWKGKILSDMFEVEGVNYDYLFYDVRLPKERMQFERGMCSTRDEVIAFMLKDLKEMNYSAIALSDFESHWKVKIPDYPYYCVYPQYNRELDIAFPVHIDTEQTAFLRSLYVLTPHKIAPDMNEPQEIPFPIKDPAQFRPNGQVKKEIMFREWGVAFLGH